MSNNVLFSYGTLEIVPDTRTASISTSQNHLYWLFCFSDFLIRSHQNPNALSIKPSKRMIADSRSKELPADISKRLTSESSFQLPRRVMVLDEDPMSICSSSTTLKN